MFIYLLNGKVGFDYEVVVKIFDYEFVVKYYDYIIVVKEEYRERRKYSIWKTLFSKIR